MNASASAANSTVGGIVLCGGRSTRMGQPKHALPFGDERMLERVIRILSEVVSPIVVVAAPEQNLERLPEGVLLAHDPEEGRGPLVGLAAGLSRLKGRADAAYVSSCDVPLLQPVFVRALVASLGEHDLAIPRDGEFHHPLAAVYRVSILDSVRKLIADNRMRPYFLVEQCRSRILDVNELRHFDPELDSLRNLNTPEDYRAALKQLGFDLPVDGPPP